ncbi:MAG: hypothetical protein LBH00_07465 [Planctomycetaceae bacterium]|jgi:hypothetical protein|nr:hypothetical protein [Planctomycetaceae bacterium]
MGKWDKLLTGVKDTAKTGGMMVLGGFSAGVGSKLADRSDSQVSAAAEKAAAKLRKQKEGWIDAADALNEKRSERKEKKDKK